MQSGAKDTEILLVIMVLKKKTFENTLFHKDTFSFLFT
jgi:hypothetical protein